MFESDETFALSRRRFLKTAGATLAGLVVFGAGALERVSAATPPPPPGPRTPLAGPKTYTYKGQTFSIVKLADREALVLNGETLDQHLFSKINAGYASHMLPFENTPGGVELAKKLIDGDKQLYVLSAPTSTMSHATHSM